MYILRVLPIENIAEDYSNTPPGMWDESDNLYQDNASQETKASEQFIRNSL